MAFKKEVLADGRKKFTYEDDDIKNIYAKIAELKETLKKKQQALEKEYDIVEADAKKKEKAFWEADDNDYIGAEDYYWLEDDYTEASAKETALRYAIDDLQKIYDAIKYFVD